MAKNKTPDPYGTLFDFVFATQKKGKRKGRPGNWAIPPVTSGLAEGLMHIVAAPGQYAVESLMKDMTDEANNLQVARVSPTRGYKIPVGGLGGLGTMLTDPRKYFSIWEKKYKDAKKLARVGGGSRLIDSAIFAFVAKQSGLDTDTAVGLGFNLFQQDIPLYTGPFDSQASHLTRYIRSQEAMRVMSEMYGMKFNQVTKDQMEQIVAASYSAGAFAPAGTAKADKKKGDKDARLDHMKQALINHGLSQDDAEWTAEDFWGSRNDDKDLGLWIADQKDAQERSEEERIRKKSVDAMLWKIQMLKEREPDPAKKAKLTVLQKRVSEYVYEGKSLPFTLGMHVGRIYHIQGWVKGLGGTATNIFLNGNVDELLKNLNMKGGLNYDVTGVVGGLDNGQYGASIFNRSVLSPGVTAKSRDIAIQNFVEGMFYLHPVNIAKGLLWDGRHFAYLAKRADLAHNAALRDILKKIAAHYPKSVMIRASKWLEKKTVGNLKKAGYALLEKAGFFKWAARKLGRDVIGLPVREIVKHLLIKAISAAIGAVGGTVLPGVGGIIGFVADQIINIGISIASKLIKPAFEVGVLVFWGVLALILMLIFAVSDGPVKKMHRYLNAPINAVKSVVADLTVRRDWADDSMPLPSYGAECFAQGGITCTQGPCGSYSHLKNGDRAVDLVWGGMTSSTGIRAPADGKILSTSVVNSRCSDGTLKGGIVYFRDTSGYTWIFVHAKPVASGSVSAGEMIGVVQTGPETQYGKCWNGEHAHVMVRDPSGQLVDAEQFLNSSGVGCSFVCPPEDAC